MKKLSKTSGVPFTVHYKSLKDSDITCADPDCGMMAQAVFNGTSQEWYICNAHAAELISHWNEMELIDDSEGTA